MSNSADEQYNRNDLREYYNNAATFVCESSLGKIVATKSLVDLVLGAIYMNSFAYYVLFFFCFLVVYTKLPNMYSLSVPRKGTLRIYIVLCEIPDCIIIGTEFTSLFRLAH